MYRSEALNPPRRAKKKPSRRSSRQLSRSAILESIATTTTSTTAAAFSLSAPEYNRARGWFMPPGAHAFNIAHSLSLPVGGCCKWKTLPFRRWRETTSSDFLIESLARRFEMTFASTLPFFPPPHPRSSYISASLCSEHSPSRGGEMLVLRRASGSSSLEWIFKQRFEKILSQWRGREVSSCVYMGLLLRFLFPRVSPFSPES